MPRHQHTLCVTPEVQEEHDCVDDGGDGEHRADRCSGVHGNLTFSGTVFVIGISESEIMFMFMRPLKGEAKLGPQYPYMNLWTNAIRLVVAGLRNVGTLMTPCSEEKNTRLPGGIMRISMVWTTSQQPHVLHKVPHQDSLIHMWQQLGSERSDGTDIEAVLSWLSNAVER
jgi:hypothetical protein